MELAVKSRQDRRRPGCATGGASFWLKWPNGSLSEKAFPTNALEFAISRFSIELERLPEESRSGATGKLRAEVRKRGGGVGYEDLALWISGQPLEVFFQEAREAWKRLPKEKLPH